MSSIFTTGRGCAGVDRRIDELTSISAFAGLILGIGVSNHEAFRDCLRRSLHWFLERRFRALLCIGVYKYISGQIWRRRTSAIWDRAEVATKYVHGPTVVFRLCSILSKHPKSGTRFPCDTCIVRKHLMPPDRPEKVASVVAAV